MKLVIINKINIWWFIIALILNN